MYLVTEELKQRITAIAARVRRYQGQIYSYRQYRLLVSDWHRFFLFLNLFIIFCKFLLAHVSKVVLKNHRKASKPRFKSLLCVTEVQSVNAL